MDELRGNNQVLAEEVDRMIRGMDELQANVEGFATGEKISLAARDKMWVEILASDDFLDMQLAIEEGMAKRIRNRLRAELENFDPMLLAAECMFEEDKAESVMGGSGTSVDADSALAEEIASERARGLKKASVKPLTTEDLAI